MKQLNVVYNKELMASRDEAANRCIQQRINEVHCWAVVQATYIHI